MKLIEDNISTSYLSRRVIRSALLVGGFAFAAGFIGPILFSSSNQGPLLGIFVTGPIGTVAGALLGIMRSIRNANSAEKRAILKALLVIWAVSLLYNLFMISLSVKGAFPAICLQGLIVISSIFFFYYGDTGTRLSEHIKKCRLVIVIGLVLVMFATLFPPVTVPKWVKNSEQENIDSTLPLPKIAFILDTRFDASHHFPLFSVNRRLLILEWIILTIVAISLCIMVIRLSGSNDLGLIHTDSP